MVYEFDDFEFDDERLELRRAGALVEAEPVAKRLLAVLLRNAGALVTKDDLVETVWEGRAVADNVITVAMARLRKTLHGQRGARGELVVTVYGRGYRFVAPLTVREREHLAIPALDLESSRWRGPFVGRERALERLRDGLAASYKGRGRVCALMGEAGIGKTRLVEALEEELARTPVRVAWGFCREAGDTPPLWPWLRVLRELSSRMRTHGRAGASAGGLSELLSQLDAPRGLLAPSDALNLEGSERHRTFDAIVSALGSATQESPWVIVLDDLHRADGASLALLAHLVDEIARLRIVVIATLRSASTRIGADPSLSYVLGHRNCDRVVLEPLRESDVARYVGALLDDPDGSTSRAVFARSEGNPFFMTELARQLTSSGKPQLETLVVPHVALELIRQRIDQLSELTREVLTSAAVLGRSFELPVLQALSGETASSIMRSLDEAIAADLLMAAPDSTTGFAFGHDLMRAALYDGLSSRERRRRHLRCAEALERRLSLGDAVPPSELAYHFHAALPESDLRKTVHHCRAAASAAASAHANSDVVRYLQHALAALNLLDQPSVRLRMSLWYTISLYGRGRPAPEYAHALSEVVRLARERDDGGMMVRAAILYNAYPGLPPMPGARGPLEHALTLLPDDADGMRGIALAALSAVPPYCYDDAQCRPMLAQAIPLALRSGSRASRYVTLLVRLYQEGGPERRASADEAADELTLMHQRDPTLRMRVAPLYVALYRAVSALSAGDAAGVDAAIERGLSYSREGRHMLLWHFERFRAMTQVNRGACSEGMAALSALHRRAEQQAILGTAPFCAFDRVVVFGELTGELPVLDDALRSALEHEPSDPPAVWSLKVRALAALGLREEARAALYAVPPSELARLPQDSQYLGTLGHLTRAALALSAHEQLEALAPLLARHRDAYAGHYAFWCEGAVPQLLAMVACARGRHNEALEQWERAIAMNERAGLTLRCAEARLQRALCQLTHGRAHAREQLLTVVRDACRAASRAGLRGLARRTAASLDFSAE